MIKMYLEGGLSGIKESEKSSIGLETCQTPILKRYVSLQFSNPTYELLSWILKAFDWNSLRGLFAKFCSEVLATLLVDCCADYLVTSIDGTLDYTFIRVGQSFDETDMDKEVHNLMATLLLFGISLGAYVIEQNENAELAHGVKDVGIRNFIESMAAPFGQAIFKQNEARDSIEYILDFVDFVADNHGVDDFVDFVSNLHKSFRDLWVTTEPVNDDEFNAKKSYLFSQYYTRIHVYVD